MLANTETESKNDNAETESKHEDAESEFKHEDAESEFKHEDAESESKHEDAESESKHEDAESEFKHEDAGSESKHEDAGSEVKHEDAGSEVKHEDAESEFKHEDTESEFKHEDTESEFKHEDTESESRHEDAESESRHEDAESESRHEDAESDSRLGDTESDSRLGDAESDSRLGDAESDSRLGDAESDSRLGDAESDSRLGDAESDFLYDTESDSRVEDAESDFLYDTESEFKDEDTESEFRYEDTEFELNYEDAESESKHEDAESESKNDNADSNLDCIEEDLWLGNLMAASNANVIQTKNIGRILTIDAWPLPKNITDHENVKTMCIQVTDLPTEDLISHFEGAFNFITDGLKEGPVLVHCYEGVSRSATVILAYLMKKYEMPLEKAFELTKSKREIAHPNQGFMAQLQLYEEMQFKIDPTNMQYKMFRLYIASDRIKTEKTLPKDCGDVVKPDPSLETDLPDPRVYRCNKCRRILASEANIIPHFPRERHTWRDRRFSSGEDSETYCSKMYFVEPMTWMRTVCVSLSGKLYCPNPTCEQKLGSYCWAMGCLCPCGTKVTPGFYFVPSKVEKDIIVQKVEKDIIVQKVEATE